MAPGGDGGDFVLVRSRVELLSGKVMESGGVQKNFLDVARLVDYADFRFSPGPLYGYKISRDLGSALAFDAGGPRPATVPKLGSKF